MVEGQLQGRQVPPPRRGAALPYIHIYTTTIHTPLLPLYYYYHYCHQVWDYYVDRRKHEFVPWAESVPAVAYDSTTPMSLVTVPTGGDLTPTLTPDP